MAKKQGFGDKAAKKKVVATSRSIKAVYSVRSAKTGTWKYAEKFIKVPIEGDETKLLEEYFNKLS